MRLSGNAQRLPAFAGLRQEVDLGVVAQTLRPAATEAHARGRLRTALWKPPRGGHELLRCTRESLVLADEVGVGARTLGG
ncbi:hypothetical protein [Streptomyces sp. LMG1-1-1.1]|uniref:hypothetical protein n=1 Tax=Streptomyces sp. LMG1-1-1.1 TaxID=3135245 RepID=UPI003465CE9B